jgi:hypothetical protein
VRNRCGAFAPPNLRITLTEMVRIIEGNLSMNHTLRKLSVLILGYISVMNPIHDAFASDLSNAYAEISEGPTLSTTRKPPDKSMNIPPSKLVNFDRKTDRVPNQYIVVFKDEVELAASSAALDIENYKVARAMSASTPEGTLALSLAFSRQYSLGLSRIYNTKDGLRGFALHSTHEENLMDLAKDPRVKFVEPELIAHPQATMNIQSTGGLSCTLSYCARNCGPGNCAPWDLDRIDQVWNIDGLYHYVANGAGVTIWIADTGLQIDHHDFSGRSLGLAGPINGAFNLGCTVDNNGNVTSGCKFVSVVGSANYDKVGHGTAVASIAAGNTYGVAKGASIGVQQVCDSTNNCYVSWIAAAIDFAIANKSRGPNILLSALTVVGGSAVFDASVNRALAAGMTVVVDAGNQGYSACNNSPGDVPGAITVGATDYQGSVDSLSSESNFGPCVDILAPGVDVWAADNGYLYYGNEVCGNSPVSTTGICVFSGTSVAAPLVAGIAALYLQNYPTASPATVKNVVNSSAAAINVNGIPPPPAGTGTPELIASVWVPGNTTGAEPPGRGFPPFGGGTVTAPPGAVVAFLTPVLFQ